MPRTVRWLLILAELALAVIAWAVGWWLDRPVLATLEFNAADRAWGFVAAVPPLCFVWVARRFNLPTTRGLIRLVDELIASLFRNWSLVELVAVSVAAGFGEELLFRALIQGGLSARWGIPAGLIAASILFGLVHYLSTAYAFYATLMGVYLGWLWIASGNLLVPVTTHAIYDFFLLVWMRRLAAGREVPIHEPLQ